MKRKDSHITQLFKKYFSGLASKQEEAAIEETVQLDDYAREAKQGVDQIDVAERKASLTNLQSRLSQRTQKDKHRGALPWLKLAAGVAILISAGLFIWQPFDGGNNVAEQTLPKQENDMGQGSKGRVTSMKKSSPLNIEEESITEIVKDTQDEPALNELKKSKSTKQIEVVHVSDFTVQFPAENEVDDAIEESEPEYIPTQSATAQKDVVTNEDENKGSLNIEERRSDATVYYTDGVAVRDNLIPERAQASPIMPAPSAKESDISKEAESADFADAKLSNERKKMSNSASRSNNSEKTQGKLDNQTFSTDSNIVEEDSKTDPSNITTRMITGLVQDKDGYPLIGANVLIEKTGIGAITDIDGFFSINVKSDVNQLSFNYTGFESTMVTIDDNDELTVVLIEDVVLSEVGITEKSNPPDYNSDFNASAPLGINSSYESYIEDNLIYPTQAKSANIEGKVVLLFNVSLDGTPTDIEVQKSLGYGCDAEAIRLLKEGPKWEPGTESNKTKLVIRFKK